MESLDHAALRRSPAENGPERWTEGRISSAPDRQVDAKHFMDDILFCLKEPLKTGAFGFPHSSWSSKKNCSYDYAAFGPAGHSRCPPLVGRMISVLPRLDQQIIFSRSLLGSGSYPVISPPSAARLARSDALLCYLENKYQVTRPNRHKDGHEETLNLLIRLCFRDD